MQPTIASAAYISIFLIAMSSAESLSANPCQSLNFERSLQAQKPITEDLYIGQVTQLTAFTANGNQTQIYTGRVRNPHNGREREMLFKPRVYGDNQGYGRTPGEYLAYRLNILLGMDYVPPVAYRKNIQVNGKSFSEGAVLFKVPDAHNLKDVAKSEWGMDPKFFLSDTRILDVLIQNPDRHDKNFLRGQHWADGSYRPMLIDHAAAMLKHADTRLDQAGALDPEHIQVVRKTTWDKLHQLNASTLKKEFGEFYSDAELGEIMTRRDQIITYFETLAAGRGWDKVVMNR